MSHVSQDVIDLVNENIRLKAEVEKLREALEEASGYLHSIHQPMTGHGPPIAFADCKMVICVKMQEALKGDK